MKAQTLEPVWSWRRLTLWVSFIFVFQVLLICFASSRVSPPRAESFRFPITSIGIDPLSESTFMQTFLARDPTLFAAANAHSFSAAWLRNRKLDYNAPAAVNDAPAPSWLMPDAAKIAGEFTAPPAIRSEVSTKTFLPKIQLTLPDPVRNARTNSALLVEGEIASRPLRELPAPRAWQHSELLDNTVVEIVVSESGSVITARLAARSGLPLADQWALEQAKLASFAPSVGLSRGKLVFEWLTLPVTATNQVDALPTNPP